jgi:hypothetical protein
VLRIVKLRSVIDGTYRRRKGTLLLQIRIVDPDGTSAVILEKAENRSVIEVLNGADDGVSFEIAKNDPKADVLNPDKATDPGYVKFWQAWDTDENKLLNFGSITNITEQGPNWKITGTGRAALLNDFYRSEKTWYSPIDAFVDSLRFENIAGEPRTTTMVHSGKDGDADEDSVFADPTIDSTFHGLSKNTKNFAIDEDTGYIKIGQIGPSRTFYTVDTYWAGTSKKDTLVIDLGDNFDIDKINIVFPWWGGSTRRTNRSYDFVLAYATDDEATLRTVQGRQIGPFHTITTFADNRGVTGGNGGFTFVLGSRYGDDTSSTNPFPVLQSQTGPIRMRYIRIAITDVHAWYGTAYDDDPAIDAWAFQCDPDYSVGSIPEMGSRKGVMAGKEFDDRALKAENDCFSAIVEVTALKEIIERDLVKPLARQRIDNNNLQITYSHTPAASETHTTKDGFRRFEPGGFFKKIHVDWSGAGSNFTTFFAKDCTNCYPDGFHFGVMDHNNNLFFASDSSSGSDVSMRTHIQTKHVLMKGASNATVTFADAWPSKTDPLSSGGSYSYTTVTGDSTTIHFRGESFRWYATVPEGQTPGSARIDIREKDSSGNWSSYSTLVSSITLPSAIHAEKVWEITYESGILQPDIVYEIRITNLGGFISIDSVEGYWSGSLTEYNEDSIRINVSRPEAFKVINDGRFSGGSMYKWNDKAVTASFGFFGDRIIITSAKGRNHGKMSILMYHHVPANAGGGYDPGVLSHVMIPGGDPTTGVLTIDLDTGKRGNESANHVIFDSNDIFTGGLQWGSYGVVLSNRFSDDYSTTSTEVDSDSFLYRCSHCKPPAGTNFTIPKYVYLDSILVHERVGLSISFESQTHLEQLKTVAEALQMEWDITPRGLRFEPRIGVDTNEMLIEGQNTMVDWQIVNDITKIATMLISNGADIDGIALPSLTEDFKNRKIMKRTITRQADQRDIASYQQLIGLARMELRRRRAPEKRVTVTHTAKWNRLNVNKGDTFLLNTRKMGTIRVRITRKTCQESTGGRTYSLECVVWPQIT